VKEWKRDLKRIMHDLKGEVKKSCFSRGLIVATFMAGCILPVSWLYSFVLLFFGCCTSSIYDLIWECFLSSVLFLANWGPTDFVKKIGFVRLNGFCCKKNVFLSIETLRVIDS
jgi:hypothetical protein